MTAPTSRPETGTPEPRRCMAVEPMESGLYRCAQSGRHDEHYFTYYRPLTPEERVKHGFAPLPCEDCDETPCTCDEGEARTVSLATAPTPTAPEPTTPLASIPLDQWTPERAMARNTERYKRGEFAAPSVSRAGTTGEETPEVEDNRLVQWARTILAGGKPGVFVTPDKENHARSIFAYEARIASLRAELERAALDTRRLDWLEDVVRKAPRGVAIESPGMTRSSITLWEPMDDTIPDGWCHARGALTVRAAIDAALSNPGASHVE